VTRSSICAVISLIGAAVAWLAPMRAPSAAEGCGEVVTVETHDRTTTRYALTFPTDPPPTTARVALVLLPGGGGHLNLDDRGCARALKGNSLVRSLSHFRDLGLVTALVDAPSDHTGEDGLAGFRASASHADDLGRIMRDVRGRAGAAVWLVGTSRGSISAANAASRLTGASAPDGVVLSSALMSGGKGGQRSWLTQTVFDVRLEEIRVPVLVVGHAADTCARSPANLMPNITARTNGAREQVVTVTGGPGRAAGSQPSVEACEGRSPHGFIEQEAAVAAGIARFIREGSY
jgi:hypothetical protein